MADKFDDHFLKFEVTDAKTKVLQPSQVSPILLKPTFYLHVLLAEHSLCEVISVFSMTVLHSDHLHALG